MYKRAQLLIYCLMLSACMAGAAGSDASNEQDAVLEPDAASRTELVKVIQQALNNPNIRLADDALTHDSKLVIERSKVLAPDGTRLNGRELQAPEQFRLIKHGRRCVLVRERTQVRWTLIHARCVALPTAAK